MSRFNAPANTPARQRSVMTSSAEPDVRNHEGAPAYSRDAKSDLYLLASVDFGGDCFYETAEARQARLQSLTAAVALEDPHWVLQFITWLRDKTGGAMRSTPLQIACEAIHARLAANKPDAVHSLMVQAAIGRADEPGELVAYWMSRFGGNERDASGRAKAKLPYPIKKGLARAIEGLPDSEIRSVYSQYSALKYDTDSKAIRFGDIVALVHPRAMTEAHLDLYKWLADRRHGRALDGRNPVPTLTMVHERDVLSRLGQKMTPEQRRRWLQGGSGSDTPRAMKQAGVTWEWMASWYNQPLDNVFWSAMAPQLPYFALLRNLRNLDGAGIRRELAQQLGARLGNAEQVHKSGIFPFQFLTAYLNTHNDRWAAPLSDAAEASVANIPVLPGRTLVLIDTSGSMEALMADAKAPRRGGARSDAIRPTRVQAAALFGAAWALANPDNTDVFLFGNSAKVHEVPRGGSLLRVTKDIQRRIGVAGHGTEIARSIRESYNGHDRVIVFTDEQTFGRGMFSSHRTTVDNSVPDNIPLYSFNLTGYAGSMLPLGKRNRVQLGGLTDKVFGAIPSYEKGGRADWPWTQK